MNKRLKEMNFEVVGGVTLHMNFGVGKLWRFAVVGIGGDCGRQQQGRRVILLKTTYNILRAASMLVCCCQ